MDIRGNVTGIRLLLLVIAACCLFFLPAIASNLSSNLGLLLLRNHYLLPAKSSQTALSPGYLFDLALDLDAHNGIAHWGSGRWQALNRNYAEASDTFESATKQAPSNELLWRSLLESVDRAQEPLRFITLYEDYRKRFSPTRAIDSDPELRIPIDNSRFRPWALESRDVPMVNYINAAAICEAQGNTTEAINLLKAANQIEPENPYVVYRLYKLTHAQGYRTALKQPKVRLWEDSRLVEYVSEAVVRLANESIWSSSMTQEMISYFLWLGYFEPVQYILDEVNEKALPSVIAEQFERELYSRKNGVGDDGIRNSLCLSAERFRQVVVSETAELLGKSPGDIEIGSQIVSGGGVTSQSSNALDFWKFAQRQGGERNEGMFIGGLDSYPPSHYGLRIQNVWRGAVSTKRPSFSGFQSELDEALVPGQYYAVAFCYRTVRLEDNEASVYVGNGNKLVLGNWKLPKTDGQWQPRVFLVRVPEANGTLWEDQFILFVNRGQGIASLTLPSVWKVQAKQ
jgi:tetratricopeptide (TPR) repeat protein